MEKTNVKIIAENRKARHDYAIHETFETGVVLTGTEVKSLRAGKANLKDSYAAITKSGELYLYNLHISEYDHGNIFNHEPRRDRKLLMDYRAAIVDYDKAIQLSPDFADAYFNRGLTHIFLGNNKAGISDLSKAGELGVVSAYNVIKRFTDQTE